LEGASPKSMPPIWAEVGAWFWIPLQTYKDYLHRKDKS
jgi:hypothetical protein